MRCRWRLSGALAGMLLMAACEKKAPAGPSDVTVLSEADLQFCASETNRYRALAGRAPLARNSGVEAFAAAAAAHDHTVNHPHAYFSANATGHAAENEAFKWSLPQSGSRREVIDGALAVFWSEGPGGPHYDNMIGGYSQIGCGAFVEGILITFVQELR